MNSYVPQPGTIPARVIEYLGRIDGKAVPGSVLCDELDIDSTSLGPCMVSPLQHGAVARDKIDGRWYWRKGDGIGGGCRLPCVRDRARRRAADVQRGRDEDDRAVSRAAGGGDILTTTVRARSPVASVCGRACKGVCAAASTRLLTVGRT